MITWIFNPYCLAIYSALFKKNWGSASSPLIFTHYRALKLAATNYKTYSLFLNSWYSIFNGSGLFSFRLKTYPLASKLDEIPMKFYFFCNYSENSIYTLFFIFRDLTDLSEIIIFFPSVSKIYTFLSFLNSYRYFSGTSLSASLYRITWIFYFTVPVEGKNEGTRLEKNLLYLKMLPNIKFMILFIINFN